MAATVTARVGERSVTVRELTVREVRDWLVAQQLRTDHDLVRAWALDDCSLDDLAQMSDIGAADQEAYAPSELAELVAAAKKLNPHFFRGRAALMQVARQILQETRALLSTGTAASSPSAGTPTSGATPGAPT